ncbi:SpoIIE family protein phosphatase [Streptomyces olivaceus]|uniref:SpoIIE family protein phosphatase n=1 Tax=Streptomyces olivaceus TaxID=47716 RepID=UPI001CCBA76A|nr:SpoIIE family protein phosphatase [Streptomyces olivaceus]MBZ6211448.1 SpoIIE family protein phosphatase [Streptomyces olivaceus]
MGSLGPTAVSRRFPPDPASAAAARGFVLGALPGTASHLVDTARLLAGELAANAVLHARTEFEVAVRRHDGRVRVRVTDRRPDRGPVPQACPAYAGTGQGLALVEQLASRYGADTDGEHKTVWFELWSDGPPPPVSGWEPAVSPCASERSVTLIDVPAALDAACRQHRHAMLRELTFAASSADLYGLSPGDLATAGDISNVISACVTAELAGPLPESDLRTLSVALPADAAEAVRTLRRVLERAEEAARQERLLTLPALPRGRAFQDWFFDQIVGQLAGDRPTAWTVMPRDPEIGALEVVPWDAGQARTSGLPTVAADEGNRIIAANGPAADLLGWEPDDLVGRRLTTLIPEHLRERHAAAFSSMLLTGRTRIVGRSVPLPALHRDGTVVPVRLHIQTQETADGRTVFVAQLTPRATTSPAVPRVPGNGREPAEEGPAGGRPPTAPGRVNRRDGAERGMSALERLSLLADLAAHFNDTPDLTEGLRTAGRLLTRRLADWCAVDLFTEDEQVERVCVVHRDPRDLRLGAYEGRLPAASEDAHGPLARVLRGAGPLLLTDVPPPERVAGALDRRHLELLRALGASSAVVAPLRARRRIFGALTLARAPGAPPFTEADLALVDDLVHSLALGVDNSRLYEASRSIAERLQRSLLTSLPQVDNLRLAARYAASSTTAQVGGDWYDSFVLPDGNTAVAIGDVTGHNLDAAIAMSQLRSMLRGIAVDRQEPPGEVLRRLDLANHSLHQEATATCAYGFVAGPAHGPWELTYACAGHPPPLLTTREGGTRYLEDGAGLLLGMDPTPPRASARHTLPAHSTLLFYTDGLVERRDENLDDALDRLRRHTADLAREPLDTFCDELMIGLGADNADDIALLAVRPSPPPACDDGTWTLASRSRPAGGAGCAGCARSGSALCLPGS